MFRNRLLRIELNINGHKMNGLFDPCSCCRYVSGRAVGNFSSVIDDSPRNSSLGVVYPNGTTEDMLGTADVLVQFLGYRYRTQIRFVPTFDCEVILGHDSADIFDFAVRYKRRIWRIEDEFCIHMKVIELF